MNDLAQLLDLLCPLCETISERRALLREALGARAPILGDVTWDGSSREFVINAFTILSRNEDGLDALLDVAKERVGMDVAKTIETLRPSLMYWVKAGADRSALLPVPSNIDMPVFLSYSRRDRPFAIHLYEELSAAGIPLWRDVHDIPAGSANWWGEIRAAIDGCSSMILCLSLAALQSTVVSDEWNYAKSLGKRIIPVIAESVFDHPEVQAGTVIVPIWMQHANWLDLRANAPERDAAFANLMKTVHTVYTPKPIHITVKANQLPHNFVPRPREFESLVRTLAVETPPETVALTAALRGAGGYGKTTLAKALCRDWRVSGAYPDGIHWVTLGEGLLKLPPDTRENELVARLLDLVNEITGERPPVQKLDAAQELLTKAVAGRRSLIIIDDVWAETHVKPFLVPGRHHATVITTRFDECIPRGLGVFHQTIDQMDEPDALALLAFGIDDWKAEELWFARTVKRLGYSAQLLGIINSAITDRLRPNDKGRGKKLPAVLIDVDERLIAYGVSAFQPENPDEREKAFGRTLEVGIERLIPAEQSRFRDLGIFPDDIPIPLTTLAALWGMKPLPVRDFCEQLAKSSLVQDYDEQALTLHDITLKYLRNTLIDPAAVHRRLLDGWGICIHCPTITLGDGSVITCAQRTGLLVCAIFCSTTAGCKRNSMLQKP
ncbi:MAG: TIR domain-containing protein [Chloroflexi bacterium]|nr:TIR domain-containing protein [Chloroflexota bacterium]